VYDNTTKAVFSSDGAAWATAAGNDVHGPVSSTDNAVARFDGVTGKVIQNSIVTLSDTAVMDGLTSTGYFNGGDTGFRAIIDTANGIRFGAGVGATDSFVKRTGVGTVEIGQVGGGGTLVAHDLSLADATRGILTIPANGTVVGGFVTTNGTSGIITFDAVLLAGANSFVAVTNSTVSASSIILLTVDGSSADAVPLSVGLSGVANGIYTLGLYNAGALATAVAPKVHYLVINHA